MTIVGPDGGILSTGHACAETPPAPLPAMADPPPQPKPAGAPSLTTDPGSEPFSTGWEIDNLATLQSALERLAECQKEIAQNTALGEQAIQRLRHKVQRLNERVASRAAWFERAILTYAEAHRGEIVAGKRKSREFPGGTVGWRRRSEKLVVVDEATALEWAQDQPDFDLVRVKVELSRSGLQAHYKASGEIPPGCDLEDATEVCYVRVDAPELTVGEPPAALPEPAGV